MRAERCTAHTLPYEPPIAVADADEFEAERKELLRAVARCAVQADELHKLEWESRKRADEVRELQQVCEGGAARSGAGHGRTALHRRRR